MPYAAQALTQSCLTLDEANTNAEVITDKAELDGLIQFKVGGSCTWLYVDSLSKSAVIIDPLPEVAERLKTLLNCRGITLAAVIDTHGHADHVSCRNIIAKACIPDQQSDALGWPKSAEKTLINGENHQYINLGDKWLINIPTPGHTDDSISLLLCDAIKEDSSNLQVHYAFCGDLILMNSLGRTNFSTSDAPAMYDSLQLINKLVGTQSLICASHDYNNEFTTTIAVEMSA